MLRPARQVAFVLAVLATILVFVSAGCQHGGGGSTTIRIGVIMPLTGASAVHGQDGLAAIKMALEKVNGSGGIDGRKVEIIAEDNGSKAAAMADIMNKLIDVNHVPIIVGPISSADTLAGAEVADRAKVVLFSPTAASPKLTGKSPYCMNIGLMTVPQGDKMAQYCFNDRKIREMAILAMNDETGIAYADAFQKAYQRLGGKVSVRIEYKKTDTDFQTPLAKLKDMGVKYLYVTAVPRTMGFIARQSTELAYRPQFFANAGIEGEDLVQIAGKAADGIVFTGLAPSPEFVNDFRKRTGRQPSIAAPQSYDAFNIVLNGIRATGTDPQVLRNYLANMPPYKGVGGEISFDSKTGEVIREAHLKTVGNRIFRPLK